MASYNLKRKSSIYDARIAGLYDLAETIGKGHFAVVKAAKHVFTGERVAVKVIDKTKIDDSCKQHLFQEVRCMKLVQHPNIVRLYEVIDTQTKLFLILELGDYDMFDFIMRKGEKGVEESDAQRYFCQIVNAIAYCHTLHVVHRDLKPENVVFMDKFGMAKLTDFGFSNLFTPGQHLDTSCGSLAYSAPEILLGDSYDAPAVDVWSLGVILYMLVCGSLPFQEANDSETLTKILDCSYNLPNRLSEPCKQVIRRMLVREPSKRATLKEIAAMPWVKLGDVGHAEILPVVSREQVSDDLHEQIIGQMVAGNIANAEDICRAVETDDYSYITATYYLLLERHLRKERHEHAERVLGANENVELTDQEQQQHLEPMRLKVNEATSTIKRASTENLCQPDIETLSLSASNPAFESATTTFDGPEITSSDDTTKSSSSLIQKPKQLWRQRTCSMVQEESEDDLSVHIISSRSISPIHGLSPQGSYLITTSSRKVSPAFMDLHDLASRLTSGSGTSGRTTPDRSGSRSPSPIEGRASPSIIRYKSLPSLSRKLPTISSSPHLVGICEEGEENATGGPGIDLMRSCDSSNASGSEAAAAPCSFRHNRTFSGDSSRKSSLGAARNLTTYSSVRVIRQRQAVVNSDVLKRYDKPSTSVVIPRHHHHHHRRPPSNPSRRSTSCSSSEASDDEERRLSLIRQAKICRQGSGCGGGAGSSGEKRDDDSDDGGAGGCAAASTSQAQPTATTSTAGGQTKTVTTSQNGSHNGQSASSPNTARNFALALMERLSPIKENFTCNVLIGQRSPRPLKRNKIGPPPHHTTPLDVKKLTSKLEKLVLAPIREIPPHFKGLLSLQNRKKSLGAKNFCETATNQVPPSIKNDQNWWRFLFKTKSHENLSNSSSTKNDETTVTDRYKSCPLNTNKKSDTSTEQTFWSRDFAFFNKHPSGGKSYKDNLTANNSHNNKSKTKHQHYRKKKKHTLSLSLLNGNFAEKPKENPILQQIMYCDCHHRTKKWR